MTTGIRKTHGKPKDKAPALSLIDLIKMAEFLQRGTLMDLRNHALLLVGYFGAFRRSELVSICSEHITWSEEGIEILIP